MNIGCVARRQLWGARLGALILAVPLDCYAYIDPNIGGWLFQLLFPVLLAIGGAWVVLRQRIRAFWAQLFRRNSKS
jgi:hypothetical protein